MQQFFKRKVDFTEVERRMGSYRTVLAVAAIVGLTAIALRESYGSGRLSPSA